MSASENLSYIINHVFLPPKLPQTDDDDHYYQKTFSLTKELLTTLRLFECYVPDPDQPKWTACMSMISSTIEMRNDDGAVVATNVKRRLQVMTPGDILLLEIRSQNAGLIIRRTEEELFFEMSELSPTSVAVTQTKGRLLRCFPGPAIAISADRVANDSFIDPLLDFLATLDREAPLEVFSAAYKAQAQVAEVRDTVHPKFITEMLTAMLRAIGRQLDIRRIHKHTRDEVLWKDAQIPWRRSSSWLLLRISLQTSLEQSGPMESDHLLYKSFMIFNMACILEKALKLCFSSEILFAMAAKISRRVLKLKMAVEPSWMPFVQRRVDDVQQELTRRWRAVEKPKERPNTPQSWKLSHSSFLSDVHLSIPSLQQYLDKISDRQVMPSGHLPFTPETTQRVQQDVHTLPDICLLQVKDEDRVHLCLADVEAWVVNCLNDWLSANLSSINATDSCCELASLICAYTRAAAGSYNDNPEDTSLMLLTSLEMWVALDKLALQLCPLLVDYDPGFSSELLEPLLIPRKPQVERLCLVEGYLAVRKEKVKHRYTTIFGPIDAKTCFGVKFFEQTEQLQQLRQEIEKDAYKARAEKENELKEKLEKYHQIIATRDSMACMYLERTRMGRTSSHHSSKCPKCLLSEEANEMEISVHEWPLPGKDEWAKSAVFELSVPSFISQYRNTSYSLVVDIFSPSELSQPVSQRLYSLHGYAGLAKYVKLPSDRLELQSSKKPFTVSHYRTRKISVATKDSVCVKNGLLYALYGAAKKKWASALLDRCDVRQKCTLNLPPGPYQGLQYAVSNTIHSSNEAIASQHTCPKDLTIHEYLSFVTLRSGFRLQWQNIARELASRNLNFNREETHVVMLQAAWQAGSNQIMRCPRDSHIDLEDDNYGNLLLSVLSDALTGIEGNWQGAIAVRTFIVLASRLLSFSTSSVICSLCYGLLRRIREIGIRWTRELTMKLEAEHDEQALKMLNIRLLDMALTCYQTFNVDTQHLPALISSNEDVAVAIMCSITIHDHCPSSTTGLPAATQRLLGRSRRLAHSLEPLLSGLLTRFQQGMNSAIRQIWAGYEVGTTWVILPSPNEQWMSTKSSSSSAASSVTVHYNLLNGTLLVNGLPLTRLPKSYETDPTYRRLFGERVLNVVPSTMSGMQFESRTQFHQNNIHFGMHDKELIICALKDGKSFEHIPFHALKMDFPEEFSHNYVHWLDNSTRDIEWRPLADAWNQSPRNWRMQTVDHKSHQLMQGTLRLIVFHSITTKAVSSMLSTLERKTRIHIIYNTGTKLLEIHLPRFKLDFFLDRSALQLQSKQFHGMCVDETQSFGALTGLATKLVLSNLHNSSRIVIIPEGGVRFQPYANHVHVEIDTGATAHVVYHTYQVDTQLCQLVGSGSFKSRLFKCYLHALTAHCLPDALTGRTGTEEALNVLMEASSRSIYSLTNEEFHLLKKIVQLTPRRRYYPRHLKVMQEVQWQNLPSLSQHNDFQPLGKSILDHAKRFVLLKESSANTPDGEIYTSQDLVERAAIRSSTFCVTCYGAERFSTKNDIAYAARDFNFDQERESQTFTIATLAEKWSSSIKGCSNLLQEIQSWGQPLRGQLTEYEFPLRYASTWLDGSPTALPTSWCQLQTTLSQTVAPIDKYKAMIFLSTLSYSRSYQLNQDLCQTLLAFATEPRLRMLRPPSHLQFDLTKGDCLQRSILKATIERQIRPYETCPEHNLPLHFNESWADADTRRREMHQRARDQLVSTLVDALQSQWPQPSIITPTGSDWDSYIHFSKAIEGVQNWFDHWHRNAEFKEYIEQAQVILNSLRPADQEPQSFFIPIPADNYSPPSGTVSFEQILASPSPILPATISVDFRRFVNLRDDQRPSHEKIELLLAQLSSRFTEGHEREFISDLRTSFESFNDGTVASLRSPEWDLKPFIEEHLITSRAYAKDVFQAIVSHLVPEPGGCTSLVFKARMWPRITPTALLQHLASQTIKALSHGWRDVLLQYGLALTYLQHAERLFACLEKESELLIELQNSGHVGWNVNEHPDWLLFEIENNILIRPTQARIALSMISPSSGRNSIMQLNMGEGKSSVIVPIVATALADGDKLVRVVVLKSLSNQMLDLLVQKLGAMIGRQIFYMPISRSLRLSDEQARQIQELYEECMHVGGILLPEVGNIVIGTKIWLERNSRDILDESDELLSARYELVYSMGTQHAVEFSPGRWMFVGQILGLTAHFATAIHQNFEHGLEIRDMGPGIFPRIRILQLVAGEKLMEQVAKEICEHGLNGLPIWTLGQDIRNALFRFLTIVNVDKADFDLLEAHLFANESMRKGLLVLRGLIADGILIFALGRKRWRVNYGLDLSRSMLAVPYRAKDTPSIRAQFSHPDATIVLTSLSYYYGGLSDEQLCVAFQTLLLNDNSEVEYERWVQDAPRVPAAFRQLIGINLSDRTQCSEVVFPSLRFLKNVVDYYISNIVFPKEMRGFPSKLSSSAWDLAREKAHPITGFSGTNDSRYILPLSISQCDIPQQVQTNAKVLDCLLHPSNSYQNISSSANSGFVDATSLLQLIIDAKPAIRVIIDVGAQILELRNHELASRWLVKIPKSEAEAVIYFDDNNELNVLTRDGAIESLRTSSYAHQTDQCLVYLDEVHTRGTDLKLPTEYRAAVTLGPNLTKDRLVQACMRMRKLGKGQSVEFYGPKEVERQICLFNNKQDGDLIDVGDVLSWSISESCVSTKSCVPLWATQGLSYQRRHILWSASGNGGINLTSQFAAPLLEADSTNLEDRYGYKRLRIDEMVLLHGAKDATLSSRAQQVDEIRAKCKDFGLSSLSGATVQEEQERELAPEKEVERHVERPLHLEPHIHTIHPDVKSLIKKAKLKPLSTAFVPAFSIFAHTSAGDSLVSKAWADNLLVTADFARTVKSSEGQLLDSFLRPVQWIITCGNQVNLKCVVLSPYETQELLPLIGRSKAVTLHIYSPRTSRSMRSMEDLSFFTIPTTPKPLDIPGLITHLNIFAGQLYLRSYGEYLSLCQFLGLCSHAPESQIVFTCDGFVSPSDRPSFDAVMARDCPFITSPVEFLRILLSLRRREQSYERSHMGSIVNGALLKDGDFEETESLFLD